MPPVTAQNNFSEFSIVGNSNMVKVQTPEVRVTLSPLAFNFSESLGSCDRSSWAKYEREDQQDATIRCLLLTSASTCFGHHYAHLQESKSLVTAFGVLFWFCWMWLVAVVGRCVVGCDHCESFCSTLIVTSCWSFLFIHFSESVCSNRPYKYARR